MTLTGPAASERSGGLSGWWRRLFAAPNNPETDFAAVTENGQDEPDAQTVTARREMIERVVALEDKQVVDVMAPPCGCCGGGY